MTCRRAAALLMNMTFILVLSLFLFNFLPCMVQDAAPQPTNGSNEDDYPFDFSSPDLDPEVDDIGSIVHHPNGCLYHFSFTSFWNSSNSKEMPYLETSVHDLRTGQLYEESFPLEFPEPYSYTFGDVRSDFIVSRGGEILVGYWITPEHYSYVSSYTSYLCLTRLNITEDTKTLEVQTQWHNLDEEPEMIKVLSGETDVYVWYLAKGSHYIETFPVEEGGGWGRFSYEMVECAKYSTNVVLSKDHLLLIRQSDSMTLNLSLLDRDLSIVRTSEVPMIGSSTGMDNFIYPVWAVEDDAFFIFIYRDKLRIHTYQDLELYRVSSDLELIGSIHLDVPEGWTLNPSIPPILFDEYVFLIDPGLSGMAIYSKDMELLNIRPISPDLEGLYIEGSRLNIQNLHDQVILGFQIVDNDFGTFHFFFSIFQRGTIPYAGIFRPNGDLMLLDTTVSYPCSLEIGPGQTLTVVDSKVVVSGDIWNYGKIEMTGSDIVFCGLSLESARIVNSGDLALIRTETNCVVESSGSLSIVVDDTLFPVSGLEISQGDARVDGILFNRSSRGWLSIEGSNAPPNLTFKDCTFDNAPYVFENGRYHVELSGCKVIGSVPFKSYPLETVDDCEFIDCGRIVLKGNCIMTDTLIMGPNAYFRMSGADINASFIGCRFEGIMSTLFQTSDMDEYLVSFEFNDCMFKDDYMPFVEGYLGFAKYVAENCIFQNCTEPLYLDDYGVRVVRNCTFKDNNVSISILMGPGVARGIGNTSITNNLFWNNNASIIVEGFDEEDLEQWYHDNDGKIDRSMDLDFINARNNRFDMDEPEDVAATMSRWIYFLPFYDRNGTPVHTKDEDMDGMDDSWEKDNGLDPTFYFDRFADDDHDRYCSYEEFKYGTDPKKQSDNPTTEFRMKLVAGILCVFLVFLPIAVYVFSIRPLQWTVRMHKFQGRFGEYEKVRKDQFRGELRTVIKENVVIPGTKVTSDSVDQNALLRSANIGTTHDPPEGEPINTSGGGSR